MDTNNYYTQLLQSNNVMITYKGSVTNELFDCILAITDNKLSDIESKANLKRKVYTIVVELLQNVYHHFEPTDEQKRENLDAIIFVLAKHETEYDIVVGNYVPKKEVASLRSRLDEINSMNPNELRKRYLEALNNSEFSEKGGAGLGMLDIARKSGSKLDYEFIPTHLEHSFFCLKIKVQA